jgi:hypothetical protein
MTAVARLGGVSPDGDELHDPAGHPFRIATMISEA